MKCHNCNEEIDDKDDDGNVIDLETECTECRNRFCMVCFVYHSQLCKSCNFKIESGHF